MSETETYEIRVQGHLDHRWSTWFDGMELLADRDGSTLIRGQVADQSALHGLIQKVRDLGLPLISVTHTPEHTQPEHTQPEHTHPEHTHPGHTQTGPTS